MKVQPGKDYAVITGDIVGSSKFNSTARKKILGSIEDAALKLRKYFSNVVPLDVDVYRGDSWQFVISDPQSSLRVGLFLRSCVRASVEVKGLDTRFAIGIGAIDFIPNNKVSSGDGQAFQRSGAALDRLPKGTRIGFEGPSSLGGLKLHAIGVILQLIDALAKTWTERQSQAISGALLGWTQEKIASSWFEKPITQQAIAQHLDRAGWSSIEAAINFFETKLMSESD